MRAGIRFETIPARDAVGETTRCGRGQFRVRETVRQRGEKRFGHKRNAARA